MRRIEIKKWKATLLDGKEIEDSLLNAISVIIGNKNPEEVPRGIEKFRIFNKIAEAFDKADKAGILELEEREYEFLKETIEKDVPSTWALNKNLSKAINDFLKLEEEK